VPPRYQRQKPVRRPKLGPWQAVIDAILEEDKSRPRRQRHTAKRIFERLRRNEFCVGSSQLISLDVGDRSGSSSPHKPNRRNRDRPIKEINTGLDKVAGVSRYRMYLCRGISIFIPNTIP
jgi:hypothetical protein